MNLAISFHAKKRFIERGRLYLHDHEKRNPKQAILSLIASGRRNMRLDQCPFYKNKIGASIYINGVFRFYVKGNTVVTCVVKKDNEWRF